MVHVPAMFDDRVSEIGHVTNRIQWVPKTLKTLRGKEVNETAPEGSANWMLLQERSNMNRTN